MRELKITIDNVQNAELFKSWLRHIDFVRKVEDESIRWGLPGSPASDEEIRQMLQNSSNRDEEMLADNFFIM